MLCSPVYASLAAGHMTEGGAVTRARRAMRGGERVPDSRADPVSTRRSTTPRPRTRDARCPHTRVPHTPPLARSTLGARLPGRPTFEGR